jgi:hypothetical protein
MHSSPISFDFLFFCEIKLKSVKETKGFIMYDILSETTLSTAYLGRWQLNTLKNLRSILGFVFASKELQKI